VSYTKSSQIFLCPSDPRATGSFSNYLSTVYSTNTQYPMSYYYHFCFYHIFQDPTGTSPAIYGYPKSVSASMVTFPAQKAMMDCVLSDDGLLDTTGKTYPPHRPGFILSLFADGHVKNVSFADCPNNTTYGYIPYGSTHTLYCNFDWTPWGVRSVNGTGGIDLKN